MSLVIKKEDVAKIIKALNLKRRIEDLERQIIELEGKKDDLQKEYNALGIDIE